MAELDDHQLLAQFARENSESAFAALVERHVGLVYSVALRRAGNASAAEEITQAVFIILARKADGLSAKIILSGWLYQTTRLTAANFLRTEIRRQHREQEAYMQSLLNEPNATETWTRIAPLLDDALDKLGPRDRDAIALRFFENKSMAEIGTALGASEDAAKVRVNRALEKLRKIFTKRGVTLTALEIAGAVSANSVQAAPVGLAKTISVVAFTKGAAAGGSTLTLVKGALKLMAWTKAKTIVAVGVGVLLTAGTAVVVEKNVHPKLSATNLAWVDDPRYWELNSRVLDKLPPVLILRVTKFPNSGGNIQTGWKYLYKNSSLKWIIATAYDFSETRSVFKDALPEDKFDLLLTLPNKPKEALREKLKSHFGILAHREKLPTDVFYLRVKNQNVAGIKPAKGGNQMWSGNSSANSVEEKATDIPFRNMYGFFEGRLNKPIIDQTGLKGSFDIHLKWQWDNSTSETESFKQALLDQLGLELVPSREQIEMLVVERVK